MMMSGTSALTHGVSTRARIIRPRYRRGKRKVGYIHRLEGKERRVREKASPDLISKMYGDYKECLSGRLDEASSRFKASFSTTIRAMFHPRFLSTLTSLSMSDCALTCKLKGELRSSSNQRFVRFTRY